MIVRQIVSLLETARKKKNTTKPQTQKNQITKQTSQPAASKNTKKSIPKSIPKTKNINASLLSGQFLLREQLFGGVELRPRKLFVF